MKKGLMCYVLRSEHDCTNGGVSSKHNRFILVGEGIPEIFEATADMPALHYVTGPHGPRAMIGPNHYHDGSMMGGNWLYTSDGRFPASGPIRIFDRVE